MECKFDFKHYREILELAKKLDYRFLSFKDDARAHKRAIYLRHDIDIAPENAIEFAKIENRLDIKATYFFLIHDIYYNILEKRISDMMLEIAQMGHEIALHFDGSFYEGVSTSQGLKKAIAKDLDLFGHILGRQVKVVSFHNPSVTGILERKIENNNFINVYSGKFFRKIKYYSDSLHNWHEGCLCRLLESGAHEKMQILTHPILWNKKETPLQKAVDNYMFLRCDRINCALRESHEIYKKGRKKIHQKDCPFFKDIRLK